MLYASHFTLSAERADIDLSAGMIAPA